MTMASVDVEQLTEAVKKTNILLVSVKNV